LPWRAAKACFENQRDFNYLEARHLAEERCRAILASIELEKRRQWLRQRETVLDRFFAMVLDALESGTGIVREQALQELAGEAVAAIGGDRVRLRVAPVDGQALTPAMLAQVVGRACPDTPAPVRLEVVAAPELSGGVLAESPDGRKRFDNTYATRLARLKRDLRAGLDIPAEAPDGSADNSEEPQDE